MKLSNKLMITLFALGMIFASCDTLIYDNLEDCPQGVYVKFFSMTPCDTDSSFIGEVSSLTLFAFDKNDKLVITTNKQNVNLTRDYNILVPLSNGEFTFVAWTGLNDNFNINSFTPGTTTKKDVMMTIKTANEKAANIEGIKVWQGQNDKPVYLPEPSEWASVFEYTAVNLMEVTNRITLTVELGNKVSIITADDLVVELTSENGTMLIDGTIANGNPKIEYPAFKIDEERYEITFYFTMLDLIEGRYNHLKVYYPKEDTMLINGDLIEDILLNNNSGINMECENDFYIKTNLTTKETYMSVDAWITPWKVHSYGIEL